NLPFSTKNRAGLAVKFIAYCSIGFALPFIGKFAHVATPLLSSLLNLPVRPLIADYVILSLAAKITV
ncbi:hypothetical protein THASP1DRAFT_12237, partial [Thamnocephalis sphaerospora]